MSNKKNSNPFWGASENSNFGKIAIEYAAGQDVILDKHFVQYECYVDKAHVLMLYKQKLISHTVAKKLLKCLTEIQELDKQNKFELKIELEDVHSNIEQYVINKTGIEVGGYLRLAIARNDQIYTDTLMYMKNHLLIISSHLLVTINQLLVVAEANVDTIMPGYTHMRISQPITVGHWLMAKAYHLIDDVDHILYAVNSIDKCPLGIVEMAGTSLDLDREYLSTLLGFEKPTENSLYTSNQRGENEVKILSVLSLLAMHMRRTMQELIIYSGSEFGLVELNDLYVTSGTAQPNLRNPDTLEVIRANCPKVYSKLIETLMIMDIQTSGYNRDTQQTKSSLLEGLKIIEDTVPVFGGILTSLKYNKKKMLETASLNFGIAPDVAFKLCIKGNISFRESYKVVKSLIRDGYLNKSFSELTPELIKIVSKKILNKKVEIKKEDLIEFRNIQNSVFSHTCYGGPAPSQVMNMIKNVKKTTKMYKKKIFSYQNNIKNALINLDTEVNKLIIN